MSKRHVEDSGSRDDMSKANRRETPTSSLEHTSSMGSVSSTGTVGEGRDSPSQSIDPPVRGNGTVRALSPDTTQHLIGLGVHLGDRHPNWYERGPRAFRLASLGPKQFNLEYRFFNHPANRLYPTSPYARRGPALDMIV